MDIDTRVILRIQVGDRTDTWLRKYEFPQVPVSGDYLALWRHEVPNDTPCLEVDVRQWRDDGTCDLELASLSVRDDRVHVEADGDPNDQFPIKSYAELQKRLTAAGWRLITK